MLLLGLLVPRKLVSREVFPQGQCTEAAVPLVQGGQAPPQNHGRTWLYLFCSQNRCEIEVLQGSCTVFPDSC